MRRFLPGEQFYLDFPDIFDHKETKRKKENQLLVGATSMNKALAAKISDRVLTLTSDYLKCDSATFEYIRFTSVEGM